MSINYTPLSEPLVKDDFRMFNEAHGTYRRNKKADHITLAVCIVIIAAILLGTAVSGYQSVITVALFLLIPTCFIGWAAIAASRANKRRHVRLFKFAAANDIQLAINGEARNYEGLIFNKGHSRSIKEAFLFANGREMGNYTYATGSGRSRREYNWGYIRVKLTRRLPHMVLDAKSNNYFKRFSNLPSGFESAQKLSLEGTFNDHFTLYAPKEYERDALYVFTPDVMAAVLDLGMNYDIEIIDNTLLLYAPVGLPLSDPAKLETILKTVDTIGAELEDQSNYYADERVGDRTLNIVAVPGSRLKSGVKVGSVIITVIALLYFIFIVLSDYL